VFGTLIDALDESTGHLEGNDESGDVVLAHGHLGQLGLEQIAELFFGLARGGGKDEVVLGPVVVRATVNASSFGRCADVAGLAVRGEEGPFLRV
jgi:hypothetical protein